MTESGITEHLFSPGQRLPDGFIRTGVELASRHEGVRLEPLPFTETLFSAANPFWREGTAALLWAADRARLAVFSHPSYRSRGESYAAFGYWSGESEASRELLERAVAWAKGLGHRRLVGPLNFKSCYDYRLRLDHFDKRPFWGEPAHPESYPGVLESAGFRPVQFYLTDYISNLAAVKRIAERRLPGLIADFKELELVPYSNDAWAAGGAPGGAGRHTGVGGKKTGFAEENFVLFFF
jgi:hypothetical protein